MFAGVFPCVILLYPHVLPDKLCPRVSHTLYYNSFANGRYACVYFIGSGIASSYLKLCSTERGWHGLPPAANGSPRLRLSALLLSFDRAFRLLTMQSKKQSPDFKMLLPEYNHQFLNIIFVQYIYLIFIIKYSHEMIKC